MKYCYVISLLFIHTLKENERTMTYVDLPDVDKYTQLRFRRRITMEKLTKAYVSIFAQFIK